MKTLKELKVGDIIAVVTHHTKIEYHNVTSIEPDIRCDNKEKQEIEIGTRVYTTDIKTGIDCGFELIFKEYYDKSKYHRANRYTFYANPEEAISDIENYLMKQLETLKSNKGYYENIISNHSN